MISNMWKKGLVLGIIMLFFGASITPSISGNVEQIKNNEVIKSEIVSSSDSNLIGYWNLNEGSGNIVHDTSGGGNINDGTIYGSVTWTTDTPNEEGYALSFHDNYGEYVDISNTDDFAFVNQDLTYACWVTILDNENDYRPFVCLQGTGAVEPHIVLEKCRSGADNGRIVFQIVNTEGQVAHIYSIDDGNTLPKNTWMFLAAVVDYPNSIKLYIDGALQESASAIDFDMTQASHLKLYFGGAIYAPYWGPHNGNMDEVRIYNKALSEEEIWELYGGNKPPVADFTWTPKNPEPDQTVTFDASASYDPDGYITLYEWDWDNDGNYDENHTSPTTSHSWSEEGNYQITLRITDNESEQGYKTKTVSVVEPFFFVHITDTHVGTTGGLQRFQYVKNCIINSMDPHPKFIVLSGDCTHWGFIPWKNPLHWWNEFFSVIQDFVDNGIPVYICNGNHDYFPILAPDLPDEGQKATPTSNLHLFALDSGGTVDYIEGWNRLWPLPIYVPIIDWVPEGSGLNQEQIDWLSNYINDYPSIYKIVFMHHPVFCDYPGHNYIKGFDETIKNGCIMDNRDEFINLCRNNVDIILSGHIHIAYEYLEGNDSINELPWLNFVNDPSNPNYMGYHGAPGWGFWSVSDLKENNYDLPVYILTGACSQYLEFRIIDVTDDDLLIWDDMNWYRPEDLIEYEMDTWQIILPWIDEGKHFFDNENITAAARIHLYDSNGNHVGINETGGIDFEILDAYYEDEPIFNETTGECINWTDIELINVLSNKTESFIFEIEGIINCTLNLTGSFIIGESGGEISTFYENITFYDSSIGRIYINNGTEIYILFIDDNGDNITDREIQPKIIMFPPNKPAKPSGPNSGEPKTKYTYSTKTTDPDGDQIYYWFDWGDGNYSGPVGPYNSGEKCEASHSWSEKGTYEIKVISADVNGSKSPWSDPLTVTMPKNKPFNFNFNLLSWLFDRFPNAFPIIRQLLGLL